MTFPVVYQPATKAASGPTPGAKVLMAWCLANYPPGTNLGIYNPRSVRGGSALSLHAEGRAIDVGFPVDRPLGHVVGLRLALDVVQHHAALGVQCVIFARKIWSNTRPTWRAYGGTADHYDHVHIELTREAATGLTTDIIRQTMGATTVPTPTTANPYPTETAEALDLLAQHAGYEGDRLWFGPDALKALHRLKNQAGDLAKANATSAETIKRVAGERDAVLAKLTADRNVTEAALNDLRTEVEGAQAGWGRAAAELATLRSAIVADVVADIRAAVAKLGGEV